MNREAQLESIFAAALDLSADKREAYLDQACAEDRELRGRVERLLRSYQAAGEFLQQPIQGLAATIASGEFNTVEEGDGAFSLDFLEPCDKPGCIGKLAQYEVIEPVGRGGMGLVLRAYDPKLNRVVAIKVMAPELAANAMAVKRFLREARAAAAVSHDHVVTIHAIHDDHRPPFIVMEFVDGQSLQTKIDHAGALELNEILRIGMQTARGLAAAHQQGLVHRDIKPANILLENGVERVKLTDFGVARAVDDVSVTQTGQIAGTPQFMSPEQAQGQPFDARSDLFSLGSVLYAMCSGRPPFRADTAVAMLRRVCDDTPRPIREVNPEIPDWLESIVFKLLAKNPDQRFQTAEEVAELLELHLAHLQNPTKSPKPQPIALPAAAAPDIEPKHVGQQWTRNSPPGSERTMHRWPWLLLGVASVLAGMLMLGILILVAVFDLPTNYGTLVIESEVEDVQVAIHRSDGDAQPADTIHVAPRQAGTEVVRLSSGKYHLELKQDKTGKIDLHRIELSTDEVVLRRSEKVIVRIRRTPFPEGFSAIDLQPLANVELAKGTRPGNNLAELGQGIKTLGGVPFQIDEKYIHLGGGQILGLPGAVRDIAVHRRANRLHFLHATQHTIAVDDPSKAEGLKIVDGVPLASYTVHYADGTRAAVPVVHGEDIRDWWNWDDSKPVTRGREVWHGDNPARKKSLSSRDLRLFLSTWINPHPEKEITTIDYARAKEAERADPFCVAITCESAAALGSQSIPMIPSQREFTEVWQRDLDGGTVFALALSPDGRLCAAGHGKHVELLDGVSGKIIRRLGSHDELVRGVAFSPDGKYVASGGFDNAIRVWDVSARDEKSTFAIDPIPGQDHAFGYVAFSPNGRRLLAGSGQDLLMWDVASQELIQRFKGHTGAPRGVAFSPDGKFVASAAHDHTARIWDAESGRLLHTLETNRDWTIAAVFSHDGSRLATSTSITPAEGDDLLVWEVESGRELASFALERFGGESVAFTRDDRFLIATSCRTIKEPQTGVVAAWDLTTGRKVAEITGLNSEIYNIAPASDGCHMLISAGNRIHRFRLPEVMWPKPSEHRLSELRRFLGHTGSVKGVAISPDGRSVLTCGSDVTIRQWNAETGEESRRFPGHREMVNRVAFSPAGPLAASAGFDKKIILWDLESGKQLRTLTGHNGPVIDIAFSRDGRRLLSAGDREKVVHLWDVNTGENLRTLEGHTSFAIAVAFSADGRNALSGGTDGTVRLWNVETGEELQVFEGHGDWVENVAFFPDGRRAFSASQDGTIRIWSLETAKELMRLAEDEHALRCAALSPDGRFAFSGGSDGTVALWDLTSEKLVDVVGGHEGSVWNVAIASDGRTALSGGNDKTARLWRLPPGKSN